MWKNYILEEIGFHGDGYGFRSDGTSLFKVGLVVILWMSLNNFLTYVAGDCMCMNFLGNEIKCPLLSQRGQWVSNHASKFWNQVL